jgi:thiol:disulfide interchange protein
MTAIGLGMALPYTVLSANPQWLKFLPKPGPWMETFKQFTGFLLVGVVIWLLWVLGKLRGADGIVCTVVFMTALGLAAWLYGKIGLTWSSKAKLTGSLGVVVIAVVGGWLAYGYLSGQAGKIAWVEHKPGLHKELAAEGHTVFINYTAAWCTKCLLEKKTVIETDAVRRKLRELGVVPIKADFTQQQPWVAEELKSYGRAGVPLDVVLPAGQPDNPIVLPEMMTQSMLLKALDQAGPSTAETAPGAPVASAGSSP